MSYEKRRKTSSKSANKRQRIACLNYAPLERRVFRTRDKKQTPHFRTYSRCASYDLLQTLLGDRAGRAHQKGDNHFSIQHIVFPTGLHGKFWPN